MVAGTAGDHSLVVLPAWARRARWDTSLIPGRTRSKLPVIRLHSQEKHRLLETYLFEYVWTLTRQKAQDCLRLTLVDGFAGGNVYSQGIDGGLRSGSPSLMLDTIRNAEAAVTSERTKRFQIIDDYFFIERDVSACDSLRRTRGLPECQARP